MSDLFARRVYLEHLRANTHYPLARVSLRILSILFYVFSGYWAFTGLAIALGLRDRFAVMGLPGAIDGFSTWIILYFFTFALTLLLIGLVVQGVGRSVLDLADDRIAEGAHRLGSDPAELVRRETERSTPRRPAESTAAAPVAAPPQLPQSRSAPSPTPEDQAAGLLAQARDAFTKGDHARAAHLLNVLRERFPTSKAAASVRT
ncbi:MAG: hypothetical protein O2855_09285 [Planctomycetota bacterium]|nr:hypothetical protein [Planctomycetota bacterium]